MAWLPVKPADVQVTSAGHLLRDTLHEEVSDYRRIRGSPGETLLFAGPEYIQSTMFLTLHPVIEHDAGSVIELAVTAQTITFLQRPRPQAATPPMFSLSS